MKHKTILTTGLLLSYMITGLYAAAPGGAGGAEAGNSTGRSQATSDIAQGMHRSGLLGNIGSALDSAAQAARSTGGALARRWVTGGRPAAPAYELSEETARSLLEDRWILHSQLQDAIAQQLATDLSRAAGGARSVEEIARPYGGVGGMFSRAILEKTRSKLLQLEEPVLVVVPDTIVYSGDYRRFKKAIINYLNSELTKIGANHAVKLDLSSENLGQLVRNNPDQFIDLINTVNGTITNGVHQCIMTELHLYDNALETLPEGAFDQLGDLSSLSLSNNQLTTLPGGIFAGLKNLQELFLSHNRLATLPDGIFAGLTNLKGLSLAGNKFATLPLGIFAGLSNLKQLALTHNRLATLPSGVFAGLTNLKLLLFNGNQLPPEIKEAIQRELPATTQLYF